MSTRTAGGQETVWMDRGKQASSSGKADPVEFFDRISSGYGSRYQGKDLFHQYYFHERMEKAVRGLELANSNVLDIGSGTGDLYDALSRRFPGMHFLATDVSAGMLERSSVPSSQRYHGHVYEHDFGDTRFDAIFMLGVTTYMDREELDRNLEFVARHLHPQGQFVATFTNRAALDSWTRALAKLLLKPERHGRNVLSSGLRIRHYGQREVRTLMEPRFHIQEWDLLNHTVFPFNRLAPGASVQLAKRFSRIQGVPAWLRFLSSDLMVHATLPR